MVRTIEAYHDIHLRLAQSGKLMGFLHDSPLALSECIFLEAGGRTAHSRSLEPGPMMTLCSVHEARGTGILTVSAARLVLRQLRRSSCLDVARVNLLCCNLHRFSKRVHHQVMRTRVL